ncbi:hypothetical protein [Shouchella clausii]|uniref:DUF4352 domain-containing protein n=1 Tax=Shouchella clausii (strain KSM-K16) TaxID=66692 RepID=Q5WLB8_SHOC1|nr:hypothetical protein [Shouchella clausii]KKI85464.1 hypothetical protein WZ76_15455 [Shouchella clausii]BAD62837.1 hypothetical protein ABC0295 [Shouchella clausii KSM-K16]
MRKFLNLLFAVIILALIAACQSASQENKEDLIQSNDDRDQEDFVQEGPGQLHASIDVVPFNDLVEEADLIANVKIDNKVGEFNEPTPTSIFSLDIETVYKGDMDKENTKTTVYQIGNEEWVFEGHKYTFQPNETYILFLKETVGVDDSEYFILNEHAGLFKQTDDETIVKLAYDDETLESTESDDSLDMSLLNFNEEDDTFNEDEIQTFEKNAFISKLNEELQR